MNNTIIKGERTWKNSSSFDKILKEILKRRRFTLDSKTYTIRGVYPGSTGVIIHGSYVEQGLIYAQTICVEYDYTNSLLKGISVPYCIFVKQDYKHVSLETSQKE